MNLDRSDHFWQERVAGHPGRYCTLFWSQLSLDGRLDSTRFPRPRPSLLPRHPSNVSAHCAHGPQNTVEASYGPITSWSFGRGCRDALRTSRPTAASRRRPSEHGQRPHRVGDIGHSTFHTPPHRRCSLARPHHAAASSSPFQSLPTCAYEMDPDIPTSQLTTNKAHTHTRARISVLFFTRQQRK